MELAFGRVSVGGGAASVNTAVLPRALRRRAAEKLQFFYCKKHYFYAKKFSKYLVVEQVLVLERHEGGLGRRGGGPVQLLVKLRGNPAPVLVVQQGVSEGGVARG